MELQETLTCLRKERGFSQAELAEELGVTRQAVSRWETGAAAPTTDNLICLSQLFGVTVDELVNGRREGNTTPGAPPPPAARNAPEEKTIPAPNKKQKKAAVPIIISLVCLFCGTILWGKLTNSPTVATNYLIWEAFIAFMTWLIISMWRNSRGQKQ